jgi:glutathione S-transferase
VGPPVGDRRRGPFLSWLAYYAGVLEPSLTSKFLKWEVPRGTAAWVDFGEMLLHLDSTLKAQPYLVGEEFTLADVLFGGAFAFFAQNPQFPSTPAIRDYTARCTGRPARARALAKDGG